MNHEEKTVTDNVKDSIHSKDQPLGKKAPGTPFAVVGLTYPLILIGILVIAAAYYFLTR
ncbi:hypothetical protein RMSM_04489 [Rhodopirellula maiorica SM1]|uniref:Uncharacterized protein n=1 Tax=Rhodopirellula maiorica SM1 TaxID=1265738 RepID=M5RGX2_9BACT|nr:hypothetical protein [Rhodopirellula maiorica]EMI18590.1 hypothetical protein RMSM_04489 [Rhodopirellula maiorica SM1]